MRKISFNDHIVCVCVCGRGVEGGGSKSMFLIQYKPVTCKRTSANAGKTLQWLVRLNISLSKPTAANAIVAPAAPETSIDEELAKTWATMIPIGTKSKPPNVGMRFFVRWLAGPCCLITWITLKRRKIGTHT